MSTPISSGKGLPISCYVSHVYDNNEGIFDGYHEGMWLGVQGGGRGVQTTPWQGFLASFYGGINEEVLLRLFLMTLLAWLGKFVSHTADGRPTAGVLWVANILAAVMFGLGHLPATAAVMTITPLVVLRAIVLNGLLGIGFGYFYTKYGLESAILSHFSADIILHVVFSI